MSQKVCPHCGTVLTFEDLCWNCSNHSKNEQSAEYYCLQCKHKVP